MRFVNRPSVALLLNDTRHDVGQGIASLAANRLELAAVSNDHGIRLIVGEKASSQASSHGQSSGERS
jgi:hypothetical protein